MKMIQKKRQNGKTVIHSIVFTLFKIEYTYMRGRDNGGKEDNVPIQSKSHKSDGDDDGGDDELKLINNWIFSSMAAFQLYSFRNYSVSRTFDSQLSSY